MFWSSNRRASVIVGTILAVLAEISSVGLLSLSGWFIAASAAASLGMITWFSFAEPSGGVRGFAIARIGTNYGQRLLLHRVALDDLAKLRLRLLAQAGPRDAMRLRDGEALDRVMSDADIVSRRGIAAITPLVCYGVVAVGAIVAAWLALPLSAVPLAIGVLLSCAVAFVSVSRLDSETDIYREKMRGELIAAVEACPELAALNAVDLLRDRTAVLLESDTAAKNDLRRRLAQREFLASAVGALTLGAVAMVLVLRGAEAPVAALILLMSVATMESSTRLADYASALMLARAAEKRLAAEVIPPSLPDSEAIALLASIAAGETLLLTGPSGAGKSTLLRRLAGAAKEHATLVELDDPIFTGTVASNIGLGAPDMSDARMRALLGSFGLDDLSPSEPTGVGGRDLSGGESMRLRLARAVASEPALLLVDEPLAGLDAETAQQTLAAVRRLLPSTRIVYALHDGAALPKASTHRVGEAYDAERSGSINMREARAESEICCLRPTIVGPGRVR